MEHSSMPITQCISNQCLGALILLFTVCQYSLAKTESTEGQSWLLTKISDKDPETMSAKVNFTWNYPGADHVYIFRNGEWSSHKNSDAIDTGQGAVLYVVKVQGKDLDLSFENKLWHWERGTGIHGLKHTLAAGSPDSAFESAYHMSLQTNKSVKQMSTEIIDILQHDGYLVKIETYDVSSVITTDNFKPDKSLCVGQDCDRPIGQRNIEREIGWSIMIESDNDEMSEHKSNKRIQILPIVMMNYRRQDEKWLPDENGNQVAAKAIARLVNLIRSRCI